MKLIVISDPENIAEEASHVQQLFKEGLEIFHLRKPDCTQEDFEKILRQLPPVLYKKIVIHSHYQLIQKYNLKGIHLPDWLVKKAEQEELKKIMITARKRNLTVSGSFHNIKELEANTLKFDYVFLSPVFNSSSKKDYIGGIDLEEASTFL